MWKGSVSRQQSILFPIGLGPGGRFLCVTCIKQHQHSGCGNMSRPCSLVPIFILPDWAGRHGKTAQIHFNSPVSAKEITTSLKLSVLNKIFQIVKKRQIPCLVNS